MAQQVIVSPVTRIEGHARILVDIDDAGQVSRGHLEVWELRGFEKLLEGTELFKMPQVTARLSVEAGVSLGWDRYVGPQGDMVSVDRFGASAPVGVIWEQFGFTASAVAARAKQLLS